MGNDTTAEMFDRLESLYASRRSDLIISRHVYRRDTAYVLYDPVRFEHLRMSRQDYQWFTRISDDRPLGSVAHELIDEGLLDADSVAEFYQFVIRLIKKGLVRVPFDISELLYEQALKKRTADRRAKLSSFLFYRMPLCSPDAWLTRTRTLAAPLFTRTAFAIWIVGILVSGYVVAHRFEELLDPFAYASAAESFVVMSLLLLVLKLIHEMGHAYACKHYGGSVPELGAYFIIFTPCAYVNASTAWTFPRMQRIIVSLAGMYFESIAAMVALLIWYSTGPSIVKAAAHQAVLLATVVTIGFNINPLMKFDGYYVLADWVRMPELRNDAMYEFRRFLKRHLLGVQQPSRASSRLSRLSLTLFGFAGCIYKIFVITGIVLVLTTVPVIGLPLATCFGGATLAQYALKLYRYVFAAAELDGRRSRAVVTLGGVASALVYLLGFMPLPGPTIAQGIVRPEHEIPLYAEEDGFLERGALRDGVWVDAGAFVCDLRSPEVQTSRQLAKTKLNTSQIALASAIGEGPADIARWQANHDHLQAELKYQEQRCRSLTVRTPRSGHITPCESLSVPGRHILAGEALAILRHGAWQVRAIVDEGQLAGGLPQTGEEVAIRLARYPQQPLSGTVAQIDPVATMDLPDAALTEGGGGQLPLDSSTGQPERAFVQLRVALHDQPQRLRDGMVALIDLGRPNPTLGHWCYRESHRLWNKLFMTH